MFKPSEAKTPSQYIKMIEDKDRQKEVKELFAFIKKAIPKLKPRMQSGMIAFGKYHYKTKAGVEADWFVVGLSSRKQYISVYACVCDDKGLYLAEKHKKELGKVSVGKSCIRFKKLEDVDLKTLKKVLIQAAKSDGKSVQY